MLPSKMAIQQLEIDEQFIRRCYDSLSEEDRQDLHKLAIEKAKNANSVEERKEALIHLIKMFVLSYGQVSLPMLILILDSIRALGEGGNELGFYLS